MEASDRLQQFKEELKRLLLRPNNLLPFEELEVKAAGIAALLFPDIGSADVARIVGELTGEHDITLTMDGSIVDPDTFERWLGPRRERIATPRWDAYEQLLISRDWEVPVITKLAEQTDDVVELLGDPGKSGPWARHGLLMGEVQSGKTATYLGVLNKALDYGYRLVIVIGGHTRELRRQTQFRLDTDLIGFESEYLGDNISGIRIPRVGIGAVAPELRANVMTTVLEDFSKKSKRAGVTWVDSDTPTVFVIKKHAGLIANVTNYIKMQASNGRLDIPMVVIDDESDWGTPNTGSETDPTRVNKAIRKLLDVSRRSSYLGITATPFANIFIDDKATFSRVDDATDDEIAQDLPDLFPSDYIRVMSSPSNYLGMGTYFGGKNESSAVTTAVDDCIAVIPIKHKKDHVVECLPNSLEVAIMEFLLGTAVRRIRDGKTKPASMLVNISRFNNVQAQVSDLVDSFLTQTLNVVLAELGRQSQNKSLHALRLYDTWTSQYSGLKDVEWHEVAQTLVHIAGEFRVELVNGQTVSARAKRRKLLSSDQRKAEDLRPTIFIGGDVLSRGLTLDGLQISYFVREPRTMDTLMQMGRWFGYRPGFDDLVRIWVPQSTENDLRYSAEVSEELRELLLQMRALKLTPRDFGLRVRVNPDSVAIVAANKAKNATIVNIGPVLWENRLAESYWLSSNETRQEGNREAVRVLIDALQTQLADTRIQNAWSEVPLDLVVAFFQRFRGHSKDPYWGDGRGATVPIADAFGDAKGADKWSVVFVEGSGKQVELGSAVEVKQSVRNNMGLDGDLIVVPNRRVATGQDLMSALGKDERASLGSRQDLVGLSGQKKALAHIKHPVLMIYALTSEVPKPPADMSPVIVAPTEPLIAVVIAFPKLGEQEALKAARNARSYLVNTVWLRNSMGLTDDGDDIEEEVI